MRGFITRIMKDEGSGFIQGDDNPDMYFDISDVSSETFLSLSFGEWVKYDLQFGPDRLRAVNIRPFRPAQRSRGLFGSSCPDQQKVTTGTFPSPTSLPAKRFRDNCGKTARTLDRGGRLPDGYRMQGLIKGLLIGQRCGFIMNEDGCQIYFDRASVSGNEFAKLSVGEWIEFDFQPGFERLRATNVRPLQSAGSAMRHKEPQGALTDP